MKRKIAIVLVLLVLLVGVRAALPMIGKKTINWALSTKMEAYTGSLQDFDLSLYRGAYQLQGLVLQKKNSKLDPIISVSEADLSVAWRELFRGKILADIIIDNAVVKLSDSQDGEKKQLGNDEKNWRDVLQVLIPVSIESLQIKNSSIQFSNSDLGKNIPVKIEKIDFKVENLRSHVRRGSKDLSPFFLKARVQEHADLKVNGRADAMAKSLRGDINVEIENFQPQTMNALLLHYLPLDITKGSVSVFGEAAMSKGEVVGYANLYLKDFDVIAPQQNLVSLKHFGLEIASAFANWFLKNNDNKSVSAHVPFERRGGKFNVDGSTAFWSAVKNRKGDVKPGFGNGIDLKNLESRPETDNGG